MSFAQPIWLWCLAGPAAGALALLVLLFVRRHARAALWPRVQRMDTSGARLVAARAASGRRRPWLLLLAVACGVVALAQPRWGSIEEPVREQAREVMLALDLSRSMLVGDVPPSRLERARLLLGSLLDGLRGERVGLIVFAGTAFVQVPLSADYQILGEFLPELTPQYMPQGGTDYAGMLQAALGGFSEAGDTDRFLIILSDGESLTDDWRKHLPVLRERGIRVIALGIGTAKGGFIPDARTGFAKDERGAVVLSRLEPATLQSLARESEGVYRDASTWVDLPALLAQTVEQGRAGAFVEQRSVRHIERFQWLLAPAVLLALLGLWREPAVRARPRTLSPVPATPTRDSTMTTMPAPRTPVGTAACLAAALFIAGIHPDLSAAGAPEAEGKDPRDAVRATVTRLSGTPAVSARDWRELAESTLAYGRALREQGHPVEEGVVRDALAGVDLGEKAGPLLADWPTLRRELESLLEPPPQPPEQEPQPDKSEDESKDEQKKEQQKDSSAGEDPKDSDSSESPPQDSQQKQDGEPKPEEKKDPSPDAQQQQDQEGDGRPEQPPKQDSGPRPESGKLGDLAQDPPDAAPPQPPPPEKPEAPKTRKIVARPGAELPTSPTSPENAAALQLLRKVAEDDSPARLFKLLEGQAEKPTSPGRDW